ncbi:MAG: hypothetical protein AAGD14_01220 [Planctomycetota bacterium]
MEARDHGLWRRSVLPAALCTAAVWCVWIVWQRPSGRSIAYDAPISFAFFLLGWEMIFARAPRAYAIVWTIGIAQLLARNLLWFPASGHAVWCTLMTFQAWRRGAPLWVRGFVVLVFVQTIAFKLAFGGMRGAWMGALFGLLLVGLLQVLLRRNLRVRM